MKVEIITKFTLDTEFGGIYEVIEADDGLVAIIDDVGEKHWLCNFEYRIIEEDNNMKELTFKEVIANIKEGEVWESEDKCISRYKNITKIYFKDGTSMNMMGFSDSIKYVLQRKQYTFEEALESLKNYKEIESCVTEATYQLDEEDANSIIVNGVCYDIYNEMFSYKEAIGKWHIND